MTFRDLVKMFQTSACLVLPLLLIPCMTAPPPSPTQLLEQLEDTVTTLASSSKTATHEHSPDTILTSFLSSFEKMTSTPGKEVAKESEENSNEFSVLDLLKTTPEAKSRYYYSSCFSFPPPLLLLLPFKIRSCWSLGCRLDFCDRPRHLRHQEEGP